jgi:5-methylcytosine-specific restriction endonuclease McrA
MAGPNSPGGMSPADLTRREKVFRRDGFRCVYCGEVFETRLLSLDHVEPRMRGGDHSEGNLVTACLTCNAAKGAAPAWLFLADRGVERANFLRLATHVWPRLRRAVEEAAARPPKRDGKR